jgi:hypothetical protein
MGSKAVEVGFAHRINTFANELGNAMLRANAGGNPRSNLSHKGVDSMMTEQEKKDAADAAAKARADGLAEGEKNAASVADKKAADERARVQAILTSPEAEGRTELANHFAFGTTMSAADAQAALKLAPKAEKKGPLASAMDKAKPSGVAPDGTDNTETVERKKIDSRGIYQRRKDAVAARKRHGIPA